MSTVVIELLPPLEEEETVVTTRLGAWLRLHRISLIVGGILLTIVAGIHFWNMGGYPGRINNDEGIYVAQAWAVQYKHSLSHYTYWYDHPPLGWIIIAGWSWLTHGFDRLYPAVMVGREVMLIANVISCGLLYMLARRLNFHRAFAVLTVVVFALSPLAMHYHRMVFLDNLAVMFTLAALVYAASPKRSILAAVGCAACFAGAVLTKETTAVLLPVVIWTLWQHSDRRNRNWSLTTFVTLFGALVFSYPLYALLNKEFFEGPGHVSLLWAVKWQLLTRPTSGSLLDPASDTFGLARSWTDIDPWLLVAGVVLIPVGLIHKRLRPFAAGLLLQVLIMVRGGYMPYPYVIALLPFAALLMGGVADRMYNIRWQTVTSRIHNRPRVSFAVANSGRALAVACVAALAVLSAPSWVNKLHHQLTADDAKASHEATSWILKNVKKDSVILVDGYVWTDLELNGFHNQVWFNKADLDPAVKAKYLPNGYSDVDYIILDGLPSDLDKMPLVAEVIENSDVVTTFGVNEYIVRKVRKPPRIPPVTG